MSAEKDAVDTELDEGPEYKVAEKVDMKTLLDQDKDDDSLQRYKEALLGQAAKGDVVSPKDDPRRVVITEMTVICKDRPDGDIVFNLDTQEKVDEMKNQKFTLKEGCEYKIQVKFRVQHEIVSGLKYVNLVYRKGVKAATEKEMLGSFGPNAEPHIVTFPRHGWNDAPKGMLYRGSYTAKSAFIDDDQEKHLEYEYQFAIKKDWKSSD